MNEETLPENLSQQNVFQTKVSEINGRNIFPVCFSHKSYGFLSKQTKGMFTLCHQLKNHWTDFG
jgi:hypothetical protein